MNAAARIISNTRKFDHGLTQLRRDVLHWLDVADRITFRLCVYVFLCLHGMAPSYLSELCRSVSESEGRRHLRSLGRSQLVVPSLQSGNRRQTCVWLCRTESVELTPGLLEMRRPQSRNIQTAVKDVFVRTLLAHLAH